MFCVASTIVALLQFHGIVNIPTLTTLQDRKIDAVTLQMILFPRFAVQASSMIRTIYAMLLVMAVFVSFYWIGEQFQGVALFLGGSTGTV